MQRVDERRVQLQQRFAAGADDQAMTLGWSPACRRRLGQHLRTGEPTAAGAVRADEIGIAKGADRARPVPFPAAPQIAAGEAQEDGAAPRLRALTLQGQEQFLDRVGHA